MKPAHACSRSPFSPQAALPASAQDQPAKPENDARPRGAGVLALLPADTVTEHTLELRSRKLTYTATAGTLPIFDQTGERKALIFYTAYVAGGGDAARPVTFVFNGGPGAASVYLHLGVAGPKVLDFGPTGRDGANARLRDNAETWLEFSDLVMIDPVGTGWSRTAKADDTSYYGVRPDAQVPKVIALYLARNGRTGSPKYLLGESYGGFRALKAAHVLQQDQGIVVSGIVMVSPLIEGGYVFGGGDLLARLRAAAPSVVAAELERNGAFNPQAIAEVERFAMTDYLATLAGRPPKGTPGSNLWPPRAHDRASGRSRGALAPVACECLSQASARGPTRNPERLRCDLCQPRSVSEHENRRGPIRAGRFHPRARRVRGLRARSPRLQDRHDLHGSQRRGEWQMGVGARFARLAAQRHRGHARIPLDQSSFRLMVVHGYADLVTPYAVSRYVLDHLPELGEPDRVQLKVYPGGHMFYFAERARIAFTDDVKAFYQAIQ